MIGKFGMTFLPVYIPGKLKAFKSYICIIFIHWLKIGRQMDHDIDHVPLVFVGFGEATLGVRENGTNTPTYTQGNFLTKYLKQNGPSDNNSCPISPTQWLPVTS